MDMQVVARGLQFPEGPIAMSDGSVVLVEIKRQTLTRVAPNGTVDVIAHLGGGPNGAAIGPDGAVYVVNNGGFHWVQKDHLTTPHGMAADYETRSIQRVDLETGAVSTLYEACDGRAARLPNDLVFDAAGGFWFTDIGKSDGDRTHVGHLLYAKPDGSLIRRARNHDLAQRCRSIAGRTHALGCRDIHQPRVGISGDSPRRDQATAGSLDGMARAGPFARLSNARQLSRGSTRQCLLRNVGERGDHRIRSGGGL